MVVAEGRNLGDALAISLVGAVATIGILIYELRNSQLYGAAMHRAKGLEERLRLERSNLEHDIVRAGAGSDAEQDWWKGGVFAERPETFRLSGVLVKHDRALALIYGIAVAGWVYVLASAIVSIADGRSFTSARSAAPPHPAWVPIVIAAIVGLLTSWVIGVFDRRGDDRRSPGDRDDPAGHRAPWRVALLVWPSRQSLARRGIKRPEALHDANRPARAKPEEPSAATSRVARGRPPRGPVAGQTNDHRPDVRGGAGPAPSPAKLGEGDVLILVGIFAAVAVGIFAMYTLKDPAREHIVTAVVAAIATLVGFAFGHRAASSASRDAHAAAARSVHDTIGLMAAIRGAPPEQPPDDG